MAETPRKPRPQRADPAPPSPATLDEQYRALEESLRDYLVRLFEGRGGGPRGTSAPVLRRGGWQAWRPEIYLVVALAAAGWAGWAGGRGGAADAATGPTWLLVIGGLLVLVAVFAGGVLWGAGRAAPRTVAEGGAGRLRGAARERRWLTAAAIGAVVLALVLGVLWRSGWLADATEEPADRAEPAASREAEAAAGAGDGAPSRPQAAADDEPPVPADPAAAWSDLLASRPGEVAGWLAGIGARAGLTEDQVSDMQAGRFRGFAATLRRGAALPDAVTPGVRRGLFEYVYALWEAEKGTAPRAARVNLQFAGYDRELVAGLLRELGLAPHLAPPHDPRDPALQVAVIRRWLDRREPPAAP